MEITANVNWLAVIVGAVVAFLVGWLWYSPILFGKKWAEGNGVELGSAQSMPVAAMATQAIGLLLISWFVGVTAASNALLTFILAVVAFAVFAISGALFIKKPGYVIGVDTGYLIVSAVIMFLAQAVL